MGTSASSNGPGKGVPFDPPWLDDIIPPQQGDEVQPNDQSDSDQPDQQPQHPTNPMELAPPRRFSNACRELGNFARTGNHDSFRKAVGHYSRTGMGGARNIANRMRISTRSAANLFGTLQAARESADPAINKWVMSLTGRKANVHEIINEIIRWVAPSGGSQDETSCRESMAQALEDLLEENPNIDFLHMGDNDIWTLIESFLSYETFNRLCLDMGRVFERSDLPPRERMMRMNEMKDYLQAEISVQIERLRRTMPSATSNQLQVILRSALGNTFLVYEGSL